jgi:hypothetical protein
VIWQRLIISLRIVDVARLRKIFRLWFVALVPGRRPDAAAIRQSEVAPAVPQPQHREPDEALLNLTCRDMEKIIYAKLGWDRDG